jgi:hypothetical protein
VVYKEKVKILFSQVFPRFLPRKWKRFSGAWDGREKNDLRWLLYLTLQHLVLHLQECKVVVHDMIGKFFKLGQKLLPAWPFLSALGNTRDGRELFVLFTISRNGSILQRPRPKKIQRTNVASVVAHAKIFSSQPYFLFGS